MIIFWRESFRLLENVEGNEDCSGAWSSIGFHDQGVPTPARATHPSCHCCQKLWGHKEKNKYEGWKGKRDWISEIKMELKMDENSPGQGAQLVGMSSATPKGCGFDSQSGHMPRVSSSVPSWGTCRRQLIYISLPHLSLSLPLSLILSPPPFVGWGLNKHTLGWGFKKLRE